MVAARRARESGDDEWVPSEKQCPAGLTWQYLTSKIEEEAQQEQLRMEYWHAQAQEAQSSGK